MVEERHRFRATLCFRALFVVDSFAILQAYLGGLKAPILYTQVF
jgi:hypothetical protein